LNNLQYDYFEDMYHRWHNSRNYQGAAKKNRNPLDFNKLRRFFIGQAQDFRYLGPEKFAIMFKWPHRKRLSRDGFLAPFAAGRTRA